VPLGLFWLFVCVCVCVCISHVIVNEDNKKDVTRGKKDQRDMIVNEDKRDLTCSLLSFS
jgi:hypothetical protein